ncbi:HPGDS [Symbiodinium sp. CCMP2592]|nr:HPGDS [Symbiodinium sp. CCMP2592]
MAETTRFMLRYGGISYVDEVVWGRVFSDRRAQGEYPFDKVPVLYIDGRVVAQSYPTDPAACAASDAIFEMAQELCTINPMINCYTGREFAQVKHWYFSTLPRHLANIERLLKDDFFGGASPSHADFNVYHHLANARLVEPQCIPDALGLWMEKMEAIPSLQSYLKERPELVGIGEDPGLVDKAGRFLAQRHPEGRCLLVEGRFVFDEE